VTDVTAITLKTRKIKKRDVSVGSDIRKVGAYDTVIVKVGPVAVALIAPPAHAPTVTGVVVAVCGAKVAGTPEGVAKMRALPVFGHVPEESELDIAGLSIPLP
jgi:hypothetical protein